MKKMKKTFSEEVRDKKREEELSAAAATAEPFGADTTAEAAVLTKDTDISVSVAKKVLRKIGRAIFPSVAYILVWLWCLLFLAVLFWAIINSFKSYYNFYIDPLWFPKTGKGMGWNFSNYLKAFNALQVVRESKIIGAPQMLLNSLIYAGGSGVLSVITACLASYVLAKYSYLKWVRSLWVIVLITNYLPISVSLSANIKMLTDLGLYDSMLGIMFWQCGAFGYIFLIYYATWKSVSWSYAEAAFIDGAGHFRTMLLIMWPMTRTIFGVLFIQQFISLWNDYMTPIIYLPSYPNLSYGAYQFQFTAANPDVATVPIQIAGLLLLAIPIFVLFMIFRNKIMGSLTLGGLKG